MPFTPFTPTNTNAPSKSGFTAYVPGMPKPAPAPTTAKPEYFGGKVLGVLKGGAKRIEQNFNKDMPQNLDKLVTKDPTTGKLQLNKTVAKGVVNNAPGFTGGDLETNVPQKLASDAKTVAKKGADLLAGNEANFKASKIANPETQEFIQGKKVFGDVVDKVKSGIETFQNKSMKALNDVKSKITGTHFDLGDVGEVLNKKITSVLGNRVAQRGLQDFDVTSASTIIPEQVDRLKAYGLINDKEEQVMKGVVKSVFDNPDMTDRGILNMKEDLYKNYYKPGNQDYATSNKLVMSIYDGLNELVGSANKLLKPALDDASQNIKDIDAMKRQLLGNGAEVEAKLKTIATNLKNGAVNSDDIAYIKQLEKETGQKILPDLEGYGNYQELLGEKNKTGKFPTAKGVKNKAIAGTLAKIAGGGLGIIGAVDVGKKLF